MKSRLSPTQAARFAEAEQRAAAAGYTGRMVSRGERLGPAGPGAGQGWLEKVERTSQHVPGASGPAERFYTPRAAELERQARAYRLIGKTIF